MDPRTEKYKKEVAAVIFAYFEAAKNKDFASLERFYSPNNIFTKFDENPPYTRQNSIDAFIYEQAAFSNISDYEYKIDELRIDLVDSVAIATFYLYYKGVIVNDYTFEGTTISSKCRVTMVLSRFDGEWKIVHEHFSKLPDLSGTSKDTS